MEVGIYADERKVLDMKRNITWRKCAAVAAVLGLALLAGCNGGAESGKKEAEVPGASADAGGGNASADDGTAVDVEYEEISRKVTANYSCQDATGETIYGSQMKCELELKEEADERTMLLLADQCAREAGEEQGNDVIEIKAVFKLPDKTEKKYLLRGKNRESLVNDSGECEDWRED